MLWKWFGSGKWYELGADRIEEENLCLVQEERNGNLNFIG